MRLRYAVVPALFFDVIYTLLHGVTDRKA